MTLIIAGTVRVPAGNLEAFRPHMLAMLTASRAEDGCVTYSYGEDIAEPGLIRVFEVWRSGGDCGALHRTAHGAVAGRRRRTGGIRPPTLRLRGRLRTPALGRKERHGPACPGHP